ncbi:DUF2141 domain-containing protein [Halioglobus maricola]|uniref:DUF2141 domain-containing protein n=1 Tax=Halioglobus maricola TaxID=2601894 RepID=A0A5P9NKR7_9GAMM|nr:DUF2141 domain-containing protein [Halioglobus maricola]QFU76463.1 DUF2141 domain-containing protein [Halioglobus maricola]
MRKLFAAISMGLILPATALPTMAEETGVIDFELSGLATASGSVYVSFYDSEDTWLGDATVTRVVLDVEQSRDEEIVKGSVELPVGEYAISLYFDANGNGEMDTNFIGIPKEPVAMSNNAKARFGPPKYKDAVFTLTAEGVNQNIVVVTVD